MKERPGMILFCAVAFAILAILYAGMAISRKNGYDLGFAVVWMLAAIFHVVRWRKAKRKGNE